MNRAFIWIVLISLGHGCSEKKGEGVALPYGKTITCDAEKIHEDGEFFVSGDYVFRQAHTRSSEEARSGKYSCKLEGSDKHKYGMEFRLSNLEAGDYIEAKVWRKSKERGGALLLQMDGQSFGSVYVFKRENGWELLHIGKTVPRGVSDAKIILDAGFGATAYFDDMEVTRYKEHPMAKADNILDINFSYKAYNKIKGFAATAQKAGVISDDEKEYVDAQVSYNGQSWPAEIRLKGDWTDHLETGKWSYRVKVKDGSIDGLRAFSVQSPHTRSFMAEWLLHELFKYEDVLTTRYEFVPVRVNGEMMGLYAMEEHFDKQLLESQDRREAPILKFDEEGLWQLNLARFEHGPLLVPHYQGSSILPYKKNRTMKNKGLRTQFGIGRNLMKIYQDYKDNVLHAIDAEQAARYYAVMDLGDIVHGVVYHNQRLYYNPITAKLEHIGYDCLGTDDFERHEPIMGKAYPNHVEAGHYLNSHLFNQPDFQQLYLEIIQRMSYQRYMEEFFAHVREELEEKEQLIRVEYPDYELNELFLYQSADRMRNELEAFEEQVEANQNEFTLDTRPFSDLKGPGLYFPDIGIQAYTEDTLGEEKRISVLNFHTEPITITGYTIKGERDSPMMLEEPVEIRAYDRHEIREEMLVPVNAHRLYFQPENTAEPFDKKILPWSSPQPTAVVEQFIDQAIDATQDVRFMVTGESIVLNAKKTEFDRDVYVPSGYKFIIPKGRQVNLINGASLVSYSPIKVKGATIYSSDSTGEGLLVLNAHEKSELDSVRFENLANHSYKGWEVTGAVTFYQSPVDIHNCVFDGNRSEDALNLVRSSFMMTACHFSNTESDAFDADFSDGSVLQCQFEDTGNDAVDISGSEVTLTAASFKVIGDKAVSVGEGSQLRGTKLDINRANMGVVVKDKSTAEVHGCLLNSTNLCYAVFQKKPEFGPANLIVTKSKESSCDKLMAIDRDSKIEHNGKTTVGTEPLDVDALYAPTVSSTLP